MGGLLFRISLVMKGARLLYVIYALALALLVVVVPLVTHSTGSSAVTGWTSLVSPGPLSPAHTSFQNKCETCHTPHKGVEPVKCIACHIGTDFGTKASTRFHANAKQCTTCHIEHDGGASLTRMNHVALLDPALWRTPPRWRVRGRRPHFPKAPMPCHAQAVTQHAIRIRAFSATTARAVTLLRIGRLPHFGILRSTHGNAPNVIRHRQVTS